MDSLVDQLVEVEASVEAEVEEDSNLPYFFEKNVHIVRKILVKYVHFVRNLY